MFIYCICTQYLVGAPFALITASIRRGMEVVSLWHCWSGMKAQVSVTVAFCSSAFFGLLFLIFLLTIPHRFSMGFRSGEFAGQSSTPTTWSFNHLLVLLTVWAGAKSCWKMKSASLKSWSAEGSIKCSKMYWQTGAVTLVFKKYNGPKPAEDIVAKFLDTSVCGGSWCLDPSLSPFQILELILLDNPHKAAVLSVGCASFSSTLFPSTQLSVKMLGYSTLWTASFFGNECLWLTLLVKGVNDCLLDNCQISLPHNCVS